MKKSKVMNGIGMVLTVLAVLFLVQRMMALHVDFAKLITPMNMAMTMIMPFFAILVIFINSYCWKLSLQFFSGNFVQTGSSFRAYAQANLMKYLPGNIGHYAGRQFFGAELGISQAALIKASVLEILYSTLSMVCCCALFCVPNITGKTDDWFSEVFFKKIAVVFCILFLLACIVFYCLRKNKYVSVCMNFVRSRVFWDTFFLSFLLCSFGTILSAMEYVVLLGQYGTVGFRNVFIVLSANYVAVFLGFVTPGAPGGIGVREAVLVSILSPFFQEELVILAAVMHRIVLILGDLYAAFASWMLFMRNKDGDRK